MSTPLHERRHDLDWLRAIAILILLFFHTGMLFNPWSWHIKNAETSDTFRYWMVLSHYIRMPLLLFISGAGTIMAMGKRTLPQFATERFKKLFIPLLFGMFIIVPPQIYMEHIAEFPDYLTFYKTVFNFIPYPEGSFSWHHLWFIFYLLIYSMLTIPLLNYLRKPISGTLKNKLFQLLSVPFGALLIPASVMLISQLLLRPFFPEETHAFVDDWAYFTFYFCFYLGGVLFYSVPALWDTLKINRRHFLTVSLFFLIPFYAMYFHFRGILNFPWDNRTVEIIFDVSAIMGSWIWVLTIIAYAQHYLNRPHPLLKHVNEGLYPFYILHQTVIIVAGYYICQWAWSITAKFWMVSFVTLVICMGIYFLMIRPFNGVRLLFGMKPQKKKEEVVVTRT
jgi:glucans biosynthesis protein C